MLKRLLTAVLILAIFMVFVSTAFSAPSNVPRDYHSKQIAKTPHQVAKLKTPPLFKATSTPEALGVRTLLTQRPARPSLSGVDTTSCFLVGWADWANATYYYSWPRRSNSAGSREFAMRFDGPTAPGYKIKVNGVYNWIVRAVEGAVDDGQVGVVASVYADNAGNPGTLVYSETFHFATFPNQPNYLYFPFTTPPLVSGDYYISFKADPAGVSTDTVVFTSDDAGVYTAVSTHRLRVESGANPGVWVTGPAIFGGTSDFNMDYIADFCQVYSSCYTAETPSNGYVAYLGFPDPTWSGNSAILQGCGQRFVSGGPDTVKSVTISHLCLNDGAYGPTSTNAVTVAIWNDDGTGNVDFSGGPLATATIPGGLASLFPATGGTAVGFEGVSVAIPSMPIVNGPWHVTASMTSTNPADGVLYFLVNSPSNDPGRTGGSVSFSSPGTLWERTGTSVDWGIGEFAFFFDVDLCHDEFSICQNQLSYTVGTSTGYGLPINVAQRFDGQQVNRVDKIRVQAIDPALFAENGGTPNMKIKIWGDAGPAGPGAVLDSIMVPFSGITYYPGWTEVVIPGGFQVASPSFYVGYELDTPDPVNNYWYFGIEEDQGPLVRGGAWYYSIGSGIWKNLSVATGATDNAVIEVEFCSIPPSEYVCGPNTNYPTAGQNFGRTGHANVSVGDAYCKMTLKWSYLDPQWGTNSGACNAAAPIVFGDFVVQAFGSKYIVFDLNTGAVIRTMVGSGSPDYIQNGTINCTPTIASVVISGTPTNVLFIGGGNTGSISAYNMDAVGIPQIWSINSLTTGALGFPYDPGNTSLLNFAVIGGTLYFADGTPTVWAVNAATGAYIWDRALVGAPFRSLATDGTNLYVATVAVPPIIPNGDVYCISAASGSILWQLSVTGPLKGATVYASYANETFPSGVAVDNGELYTVSSTMQNPPVFPADGVYYKINATTGAVLAAKASAHVPCYSSSGNLIQSNVIIDANKVIVPTASIWATPPLGGELLAYNRFTSNLAYASHPGDYVGQNGFRADAVLSCEPGEPDQLFASSIFGYLSCFNADDGDEIFNRRIDLLPNTNDGGVNRGAGVAMSHNGDVLFAARYGALYCLSKQSDRPRLEITNYYPSAPTYGPLTSVMVDFGGVFTNTGCATLTGNYYAETTLGSGLGAPRNSHPIYEKAASIADKLTSNSADAWKYAGIAKVNEDMSKTATRTFNRAAAAVPVFINNGGPYPFTLNPGDTGHLIFDINQSIIARGPHPFYAYITSNDPDFFLNNVSEAPYLSVMLVGGCITDTTTLNFGASSANWGLITNNGRVANGDWTKANGSYVVDNTSHNADVFQGSYIYGVSKERIALNTVPWTSGATENDAWVSLQADPNICNTDCKPALTTGISLGAASSTGLPGSYAALTGNLICRRILDSVQDFGTFSGFSSWDWTNVPALFNPDSTIGLQTDSRVIGFVNAPAAFSQLNNVIVDFMKIYPRNAQAVTGWKMGVVVDYDMGKDSGAYAGNISAAWDFPTSKATGAYGWIKLPYGGCGAGARPSIINAIPLNEDQALFNNDAGVRGNGYLDSAYAFMSKGVGNFSQSGVTGASDQAFHATVIQHDWLAASNDTLQFALVHFLLPEIASPKLAATFTPLSQLLNKWVGYGRGDVNNDGSINIADIVYLAAFVNAPGTKPGPIPFAHIGDVDGDGNVTAADVTYLINYYFYYGPCPVGKFITY